MITSKIVIVTTRDTSFLFSDKRDWSVGDTFSANANIKQQTEVRIEITAAVSDKVIKHKQ